MTPPYRQIRLSLLFLLLVVSIKGAGGQIDPDNVAKPWTYWWWMGSSVTKDGITKNLEDMHVAGIGGVHIVPIYGEKGDEQNFIRFLSPQWMEMLRHTVQEAKRLNMGVDMTSGTGWPFGGPGIRENNAAKSFYVLPVKMNDPTSIRNYYKPKSNSKLIALVAMDPKGNSRDITSRVDAEGIIQWGDIRSPWRVYAAFQGYTQQKVKRAAPGGEGFVMDYFSDTAIAGYMKQFEEAFAPYRDEKEGVRAFYNDSYEVYGANWTPGFLSEFRKRRGYELLNYLDFIADTVTTDTRQRVVTDYCETVSDLLYEKFTANWVKKSHQMGMLTRNQAHGSPGNILDLYALSDIPETESFGASGFKIPGLRQDADFEEERFGRPNPLTMKFASSAAHLAGRRLVSSESTTWLGDHFKVSLSQIKPQVDELFVSGINHLFFHGTTYSPPEKPFPGRLFYASTNYGPSSHFWNELPSLTGYIAKCQGILQNSVADNDILLYFPIHEIWRKQKSELMLRLFDVHKSNVWLQNSNFGRIARQLWDEGYSFDYVSDRMIMNLKTDGASILSGDVKYRTILVPAIGHMPLPTLKALSDLASKGATIIFENGIPEDIPGLAGREKSRKTMVRIKDGMERLSGSVSETSDILETLASKGIRAEELSRKGLAYTRKKSGDTTLYFISNLSDRFSEGWVELCTPSLSAEIYDPVNELRGNAAIRKSAGGTSVYLQLLPGQSCFLSCPGKKPGTGTWRYHSAETENRQELKVRWLLTPTRGFPEVPEPVVLEQMGSWTKSGGKYITYSGKAVYSTTFEVPANRLDQGDFLLDLGVVRETASVRINGREIGLNWCLPNRLVIPRGVIRSSNNIEIEVTNLSFNRVIQIDREGGNWKNFYEVNFVNIRYQPYNASGKTPEDSGLLTPVYLVPLRDFVPGGKNGTM